MPSSVAKLAVRPLAVLFHVSLLYAFEAVDFPDASEVVKVIPSQLFPTKSQEKTGASKEEEEQDSLIKLAEMSLTLASARRRRRTEEGTDGEPTRRSIEEETEGEPAKETLGNLIFSWICLLSFMNFVVFLGFGVDFCGFWFQNNVF